jgi:hypothetical protein
MPVLTDPAWQGVGAIIALLGLVAYLWFEFRPASLLPYRKRIDRSNVGDGRSQDRPTVRCIVIAGASSEKQLYDEVSRYIRNAREAIYRSGRGFQHEHRADLYRQLLIAEKDALGRGVKVTRVHTGARVAPSWADAYADLLERFPDRLKMVVDFDNMPFSDIGLVDPYGPDPVVYLLFETPDAAPFGIGSRPALFLIIEGAHSFAKTLCQQFVKHAESLMALRPLDVRELSKTFVYFGWGVHMAARRVQRDVPEARKLGAATIRGWQRDVTALLAGPADKATIHYTGDPSHSFDGVAYELSWWEKVRLDRIERRAYESVPVVIEVDDRRLDAFTYIPLPSSLPGRDIPAGSWMATIIEGAVENDLVGLLAELRVRGVHPGSLQDDDL